MANRRKYPNTGYRPISQRDNPHNSQSRSDRPRATLGERDPRLESKPEPEPDDIDQSTETTPTTAVNAQKQREQTVEAISAAVVGVALVYILIFPTTERNRRSNILLMRLAILGYLLRPVVRVYASEDSELLRMGLVIAKAALGVLLMVVSRTMLRSVDTSPETFSSIDSRLNLCIQLSLMFVYDLIRREQLGGIKK